MVNSDHAIFVDRHMNRLSNRKILKLFFLSFLAIMLSYLSADRFLGMDRDYLQYLDFFQNVDEDYDGRFEIGFVILSIIIKKLGLSFWILLFVSSLLSLSIKIFLISRLRNWPYYLLIYILILYPLHEMTQVRVSIALSFGYLAIFFAFRENLTLRVVCLSVLAVMFHWTLLLFVPFIYGVRFFKKRSLIKILSVVIAPAVLIYSSLEFLYNLNPQVIHMLATAGEMQANPFSSRNIVFVLIIIVGFFNINRLPKAALPWYYLSVFGVSIWYGMMPIPVFAHRIFELTMFSSFFWVSWLPKYSRITAMVFLAILSIYMAYKSLFIDQLFQAAL